MVSSRVRIVRIFESLPLEDRARRDRVALDLVHQRLTRREGLGIPQPARPRHRHTRTVHFTGEIEQMNLETARVHAERGARALVHHAIVPLAIDLDPHGIYAIRRQQLARIGRREVDRRHPDRPSPPRTPLHHGPQAVRATQPALGRRQVAVRHGGPDKRRRDRLPVVRHGRDDVHGKPVLARQPPHHLHVARPPAPEPMVVPQNQLLHPEARPQYVAHELLGSEPRQLRRERHHLDPLDAERCRQHALLVGQREQPRRGARVHDLERVRVEGHEQARAPPRLLRAPHDLAQHRLVSAVDPVERPDGRDRGDSAPRHCSTTTTRGLSTSSTRSATATRAPFANKATHPASRISLPAGTGRPCTTAARTASSSSRAGSSRTSSAGSRSACAVTASGATASASRNGPTRVRLRLARCAPQPSASPTSRARLRRYVPPLTVARKPTSGGAKVSSSSSVTSTRRGRNTTLSPRRARRYARSPATFTAEYAGGRWSYAPRNPASASSTRPRSTPRHASEVATVAPVVSSVAVVVPSRIRPSYALAHPAANSAKRVARPSTSTSSPDANGSSVPRCPTRSVPTARRTASTTSCDVGPSGPPGFATSATPEISPRPP